MITHFLLAAPFLAIDSKVPNMRLKVSMKLLTIFDDFKPKFKKNEGKSTKLRNITIFYNFEAHKVLAKLGL